MVLFPMLWGSQDRMCEIKQLAMSLFLVNLVFINVSGAMNRHCIPGLTIRTALTGNFSAGVSGE